MRINKSDIKIAKIRKKPSLGSRNKQTRTKRGGASNVQADL